MTIALTTAKIISLIYPSLSYVTSKSQWNIFCELTTFFVLWYSVMQGRLFNITSGGLNECRWCLFIQSTVINKYIHYLHVQRITIHLSWEKISATRQSRTQNDRQRYGCDIYHTKFNSYFKTRTRSINSDRLENHNFFFSSISFFKLRIQTWSFKII